MDVFVLVVFVVEADQLLQQGDEAAIGVLQLLLLGRGG